MMGLFDGTDLARPVTCEQCGVPLSDCQCRREAGQVVNPANQTARLSVEKRKKGKVVTVIRGLLATANDLDALLKQLKSACGAGGTLEADTIEIQGEHLTRLRDLLSQIGYRVRG